MKLYEEIKPLLINPRLPERDGTIKSLCPCHDSKSQISLSLHPKYGLRCWAGCKAEDITAKLRELGGKPPETHKPSKIIIFPEQPCAVFQYCDVYDNLVAEKGRFEAEGQKSFKWRLPESNAWDGLERGGLKLVDIPLFGTELVSQADPETSIFFVEGEKAAIACRKVGLLAVCHGGGAGIKDFGASMDVLYDRKVILWPDNDPGGRELMRRIKEVLLPIAKQIRVISPSVPEKGDAYDYFNLGGTVKNLEANCLFEKKIEWLTEDHYHVTLPSQMGFPIRFDFEQIKYSKYSLEVELIAAPIHPSGCIIQPFIQRINLLSSSGRRELERELTSLFGKEYGWTRLINDAFALVRSHFIEQDRKENLAAFSTVPVKQSFLVEGIIPEGTHTLIFGDGHSGKSFIGLSIALSCTLGQPWLGQNTKRTSVLYIDYEDTKENLQRRLYRLAQGLAIQPPPVYRYPAMGIPLSELVPAIKAIIQKDNIRLIIVDSVGMACGGRPEEAECALQYLRGIDSLGVTTLSIAHISKGSDTMYPFGSIFFHNGPRRTWYAQKVQDEENPEELSVGLYCRKVNDGPKPLPFCVSISFEDPNGPVNVNRGSFDDVPELDGKRSLKTRIWERLASPQTTTDLANLLVFDAKTVDKALRRNPKLFVKINPEAGPGKGKKALWARKSREEIDIETCY